ncbi:MAG: type II toxin-antitoxin system death-on-curing family toxin [Anaerolineales bacterium]
MIQNHPFVDGNKRTGHAAMEAFLMYNGYEISANMDEQAEIRSRCCFWEIKPSSVYRLAEGYITELS